MAQERERASSSPSRDPRRCPYCHDAIEPAHATRCATCDAAHHPDCWGEARGCATCGFRQPLPQDAPLEDPRPLAVSLPCDPAEACRILDVPEFELRWLVERGQLTPEGPSEPLRFRREEVLALRERWGRRAGAASASNPTQTAFVVAFVVLMILLYAAELLRWVQGG